MPAITVIDARREPPACFALQLPPGSTVGDALRAAQRLGLAPVGEGEYGVFGRRAKAGTALHDGDRIECCAPLRVDPKLARRRRAEARRPKG